MLSNHITKVEEWSNKWGFKLSSHKTKTMFFTRKIIGSEIKLKLHDQEFERVKHSSYLIIFQYIRLTNLMEKI